MYSLHPLLERFNEGVLYDYHTSGPRRTRELGQTEILTFCPVASNDRAAPAAAAEAEVVPGLNAVEPLPADARFAPPDAPLVVPTLTAADPVAPACDAVGAFC